MTKPSDAFVPLKVAPGPAANRDEFRVLVAQRPELARSLRELSPPAAKPSSAAPNSEKCQPRVTLQKEADRVTGIRIECSCGQTIDLNCVY